VADRGFFRHTLAALLLGLIAASAYAQGDEVCLECHSEASLFEGSERADTLVVTAATLDGSVHGEAGLGCVDCHQDLAAVDDYPHDDTLQPARCGPCHAETVRQFADSLHGYAGARGNPRAPTCVTCHLSHAILSSSDPESRTHKVRMLATCAECHGTAGLLTDQIVKLPQSFTDYAQSVHGQGAARGVAVAASCADCHGVHDLRGAADPRSPINSLNVFTTCGACHPDIQLEYQSSIHGRALQAGVTDSPTCTDCHGEHLILSPRNPDARSHGAHIASQTCGACHNDPVMIHKYSLKETAVDSYEDSYHGWATRRNYERAATCVSCHTAHAVLPKQHLDSTVHANNLVETCRTCHPDADARFAASYTHEAASVTANPVNIVIRNVYLIAIVIIIGGMILHNLVIMNYFMITRREQETNSDWVQRFDGIQIAQHLLLTVSFTLLAVTGFALRYPEAWWVRYLTVLGMTEPVRQNLHRAFAVLLILVSLSHAYYVLFMPRGRREFSAIMLKPHDARLLFRNLRFYTWRSETPVKFGRYDYMQKAEYWALVWGTIVMIFTGFVLWYPQWFVSVLPVWIVSASQTVHYYEAWLASLAILVWHFFFVIFHPEQYPMSWTWLTGKMPLEAVKQHHRAWYEEHRDEHRAQQADGHSKGGGEAGPAGP